MWGIENDETMIHLIETIYYEWATMFQICANYWLVSFNSKLFRGPIHTSLSK